MFYLSYWRKLKKTTEEKKEKENIVNKYKSMRAG